VETSFGLRPPLLSTPGKKADNSCATKPDNSKNP